MLRVRGLEVELGGRAILRGLDLELPPGGYGVVLGPSGTGKTVLLETLAGRHLPAAGEVFVGGHDHTRSDPSERGVGYVPQDGALFPHLDVLGNIRFLLSAVADPLDLEQVVELLGLAPLLRRSVQDLSGGERQRVALARAIVRNPALLLLDEPASALDSAARRRLWRGIARLRQATGATTLHVTHDFDEASRLADRGFAMLGGRVVQRGEVGELLRRPATVALARFVEVGNLLPVERVEGAVLHLGAGVALTLPREVADCGHCSIRPEAVITCSDREGAINEFPARVRERWDRGPVSELGLGLGDGPGLELVAVVSRSHAQRLGLEPGCTTWARVAPEDVNPILSP